MKHWLNRFPKLDELYERIGPLKQGNVLTSYVQLGEFEPLAQKGAEWLEGNLARLDSDAWEHLIKKVLPYSCSKQGNRGWQLFFDHLNESRGYVLLADRGYSRIDFIPPEKQKTPDLVGEAPAPRAIVEVKTINRSDDDRKRNDPTFSVGKKQRPGDIKGLPAFAKKLVQKTDVVSTFLSERLDKPAQELLASALNESSYTKQIERVLVHNLNEIIKGDCIYEKERFRGVELRTLTRGFMKEKPKGTGLVFLNRLLLEDAYPQELSKLPDLVVDIRPDMPMPAEFKAKLENAIETARPQLLKYGDPKDKRIVLLVINRDLSCMAVGLREFEATHQTSDLEVVCQIGDI